MVNTTILRARSHRPLFITPSTPEVNSLYRVYKVHIFEGINFCTRTRSAIGKSNNTR